QGDGCVRTFCDSPPSVPRLWGGEAMRTDCTQLWEFIGAMWSTFERIVFSPWRRCNFWLCYVGLVILFVVLLAIILVLTLLFWMIGFLCETLCMLMVITTGKGTCLVFSAPPPRGNRAPTANAGGPYAGRVGVPVSMTAAASADPEGATLTATWNFGDGSTGSGLSVSHSSAEVGVFNVTVSVSDGANTATASTTANIVGIGGGPAEPPIDTDH